MANQKKTELKRVNINLPVHIIERVKEYADNLGINNTSAYIVLINQGLQQDQTIKSLPTLLSVIPPLLDATNNIDDDK